MSFANVLKSTEVSAVPAEVVVAKTSFEDSPVAVRTLPSGFFRQLWKMYGVVRPSPARLEQSVRDDRKHLQMALAMEASKSPGWPYGVELHQQCDHDCWRC